MIYYGLTKEQAENLYKYLLTRPAGEVLSLIEVMQSLKQIQIKEETQEETTKDLPDENPVV